MLNQLGIIENELKQLHGEIPKKQAPLKEALNHALTTLTHFKNTKDKDHSAEFPADEVIKPFPQIVATKNPKIISHALTLLQSILNYGFAKHKQVLYVMSLLSDLLDIPDDSVHLKVLQTMLVCITPKYLDFNEFQIIEKLLNLIVQMYNSKNIMIHNPASAAIFQLSSLIFDQFIAYIKVVKMQEGSANQEKFELTHAFYQRTVQLLRDFIMIANGQKPSWNPQNITLPKTIGFDLINEILKQTSQVLKQAKEAHQLIRKDFIPTLSQNFELKNQDFQSLLRTLKAASRILVALDDGLELIDSIVGLLSRSEQDSEKYLCVEAFHIICSSPDLMHTLNERRTSNGSYFTEILNNLVKISTDIQADADFQKKKSGTPLNPKLFKILDSNITEYETPNINSIHIHKSLVDCMAATTQTFIILSEKVGFTLGIPRNIATTDQQKSLTEWLSANWKLILKVLKALLSKDTDETLSQNILNIFQKQINLFGSLNFPQARDSFIIAICQACLPPDDRSLRELSLKNIQTTKMVFNIAHCFGGILDTNSWHNIFVTLQKTEILFDRIRNQFNVQPPTPANKNLNARNDQDKNAVQRLINQDTQSSLNVDMEILGSALDSLFIQSSHFPMDHFKQFLEALHQLCLDYLEKATSPDYLIIEGVLVEPKTKIFGLSRMLESILGNLERIEEFWGIVLAHYVCVTTNSKNLVLRSRGVENLNILTEKVFQYFSTRRNRWEEKAEKENKEVEEGKEGKEVKKEKYSEDWSKDTWQQIVFQPWVEISKTRFADVKENICASLLKLLQNNGHEIDKNGWNSISLILLEVSQDSVGNAAKLGFRCLETAVGDYLQDFDIESVKTLVKVVENFKNVSKDNNISYQSVGMFWKIGDYIAKLYEQEQKHGRPEPPGFEGVWMFILNRLVSDANSDHTELRTSAIHTFANLMIHHGNNLGLKLWNNVISEMVLKLIDELLEAYISTTREGGSPNNASPGMRDNSQADKSQENTNAGKKWEDTLAVLMQNFIKMIKKYLVLVEKQENLTPQSQEIIVLRNTLNKLKGIIMVARNELINESIKFFHEIVSANPEILKHIVDSVFEVLEIIKAFLVEVRQNGKEIKIILNKFIPEVLEILTEQFEPQRYAIINPNKTPYAKHLFGILEKAIFYSRQAENYNLMVPTARVMIDVKPVYDFLDKIPSTLCENNPDMTSQYFQFIINVLNYHVTDKFTDGVVRKIITVLDDAIYKKSFDKSVYLPYLPKIFEKMKEIFCQRSNNEFLVLTTSTMKTAYPIWLYLTDYFHKIVAFVLEDFKDQLKESKEKNTPLPEDTIRQYNELAQQIIEIYEKILKEGQKNIENISKGVLADIKKDWLEMDMKFINSIANTLVPSFALINYDLLWKLITILDFAFSFHTKNPALTQSTSTYSGSYVRDASSNAHISKITLEILFRISDVSQESFDNGKSPEEELKKLNLTKFATQKLLLKCRNILKEYIYDENRSGNMPLPRARTLEISDIFEKLRRLNIPKETFLICDRKESMPDDESIASSGTEELEEDKGLDFSQLEGNFEQLSLIKIYAKEGKNESLIQGPKGHLVYLMPIFSEFITCKDADLKVLLKKIFLEISKEII